MLNISQLRFVASLLLAGLAACSPATQKQGPPDLVSYFKEIPLTDTLHFEVSEAVPVSSGDSIPTSLFFRNLETRLMNDIRYFDNSEELRVFGLGRFHLNEQTDAYLVDLRQHWYQHQSLFLFDKTDKEFTNRLTVAEFYGGDGGQILTGSWLFDYDSDGSKDLVRQEIEHWIDLSGEEPKDTLTQRAALLLWQKGQFVASPVKDSATLVKSFPIRSFW